MTLKDRKCSTCEHCSYRRGFIAACHYSYEWTDENGVGWTTGVSQDVNWNAAKKCEFYKEKNNE